MFAFLIIWIHLKQNKKKENRFNLRCFTLFEERKKNKKIKGWKCVSYVSILTEECLGSCHALWRWQGEKRGPKLLWWATKNSGRTPNRFPEGENPGKILACAQLDPHFLQFSVSKKEGAKSLKGQDNRKGYSFQLQTKPASVCGYSIYIPIYRYMRSILSIYTDYIYSIWNKSSLTGKRLPTVPGRFWWIWS